MRSGSVARVLCLLPAGIALAGSGGVALEDSDRPFEGFGATTEGGANGTPYVVTSLANSGEGTLRDAVSESNRNITFDVGGTIVLESYIGIPRHHITIDGSTAPPPGVTLRHYGMSIAATSSDTAHDVIVRHIRFTDGNDNMAIAYGAQDIVIDHCSFRRASDGNIDLFDGAHDITIQWSILADNHKNSLIRDDVTNLSLHHNLYAHGDERNPQVQASCLVVDVVNNVIYDWDPPEDDWGGVPGYGTRFRSSSTGNLIKNVYVPSDSSDRSLAVILTPSTLVYTESNVIPDESDDTGTTETRGPAPPVTEMAPGEARDAVLAEAGAWPRDADDSTYVARVWDAIIGVDSDVAGAVARILLPATPNPSGAGVGFTYVLSAGSDVRLSVYDVGGRHVRDLVRGLRSAGLHETIWNGRDTRGRDTGSGVYIVRLETESGTHVRRIVRLH